MNPKKVSNFIFSVVCRNGKNPGRVVLLCRVVAQMHRALTGDEPDLRCISPGLSVVCVPHLRMLRRGEDWMLLIFHLARPLTQCPTSSLQTNA